jgi:hypothetical protein
MACPPPSPAGSPRTGAAPDGSRVVAACLLAAVGGLIETGCVQRRMTIRSNPPGALVYVDDYQIGTTPVSTDFVYYGTRKIRLVKDGFETLTVRQPVPLPWYQIFPLDFVTENVVPWEIRDERVIDLAMVPAQPVVPESVVARAETVRAAAMATVPRPAPPPPPPIPVPAQPIAPPAQVQTVPAGPPVPLAAPPQASPLPPPAFQQQAPLTFPSPPPAMPPSTFVPPSGGPSQPGGF